MRQPRFDARRLDVEAFALEGATLEGEWPTADLPRLLDGLHAERDAARLEPVRWKASGECRKPRTGDSQAWLRLKLHANLPLVCQRCLGPVDEAIDVDTTIRFVRGEEAAAQLDAEGDADVLALTRSLDLKELAEDELLLALPLVPRHVHCPPGDAEIALHGGARTEGEPGEHPFAALAQLKAGSPSDP